jgi:hypothetical protein
MESSPKPSHSNKQRKTITASPTTTIYRLPQRTIAVTHPNLYSALKKWQNVNMPQSQVQQSPKASIQSKTSNSDQYTLHIIDSPSSTMAQKRNELWGSSLLQLPTTIGMTDLNPPSKELQDQRLKAVNDRAEAVRLVREDEKQHGAQREKIKRLTAELETEQQALTFMETKTGSALAKAASTTIIDGLDQEIAKQKLRPSIMKIKLWRHRQHGKTFVNGMNALFNFRKWNTNDDQDTKVAAGSQDNTRNLGTQTAAILYVYWDISNWFSEDELCTLLGYAFRNHNVKQAVHRMVERDMLISQNDSAGTEKYYLSKVSLEFVGRSPEDIPDIEKTNPTYTVSIEIRKKEGLTLINSRKQLETSPLATSTTPQTGAAAVAEAETKANRTLDFNPKKTPSLASAVTDAEAAAAAALSPPSKRKPERALKSSFKKRTETMTAYASTASTAASDTLNDPFTATPSDSLESDEEPPAKTIDLSQSSSSDYSDSEDTDSEDTPEETFQRIIPAGRKGGTNFDNVRDI